MVKFNSVLAPLRAMANRLGIDLEACWNGNEALICYASATCLQCQKANSCRLANALVNVSTCPNKRLFDNLPRALVH